MNYEEDEIRLGDILHSLISHKVFVIMLTIAGLFVGMVFSFVSYTLGEISKEYAITTSIAVTAQTKDGLFTTRTQEPNSADFKLAEDMADSVIYILKSDKLLNAAIDRVGLLGVPPQNISTHLSISKYRETQIIEITLYWRSADEGVRIMNAINEVTPSILRETLKIGGVSVVNEPLAKYRVGGSFNALLWVYMAIAGFAVGVAVCAVQVLLYPKIVNASDLEDKLNLELLGEIPANKRYYQQKQPLLLSQTGHLGSDVREGYASAAYILHNWLGDKPNKYLYITSTQADEGKTQAVANLAVQLSRQEHRVLMIDFDTKNPSLGGLFFEKVPYENTLNALYRGSATPDSAIVHLNGYLDLLPAVLDRREIPLDDTVLSMVKEIADCYEYVLMDTSPVGCTADMMRLNRIADGVILVVRYDKASLAEARDTVKRLDQAGVKTIGGIFNDARTLNGNFFKSKPKTKSKAPKTSGRQKQKPPRTKKKSAGKYSAPKR